VAHHDYPITFGITAGIMMVTGLVTFARLMRDNPVLDQQAPTQNA
jgi:hypothetical protein